MRVLIVRFTDADDTLIINPPGGGFQYLAWRRRLEDENVKSPGIRVRRPAHMETRHD